MFTKSKCRLSVLLLIIYLISALLLGCTASREGVSPLPSPPVAKEGKLTVHFLDVGQGDAIFLRFPGGETLLVDGGPGDSGEAVVAYLKKAGVTKLTYLVATHPHEDHIGGLKDVLEAFPVETAYLPRVAHTSVTYTRFLSALEKNKVKVREAKAGVSMDLKQGVQAQFLAPVKDNYADLNNYSAVLRVTYGQVSFLLTGDAEKESEAHMLANGARLEAAVLKLGHHGSSSSTSPEFLRKVKPNYAIISAAKENDYGHPHKETLALLAREKIQTFWTALAGTIVMETDGQNLAVNKEAMNLNKYLPPSKPGDELDKLWVDSRGQGLIKGNVGNNGKVYHLPGGEYYSQVKAEAWFKTEREAQQAGFRKAQR
ncbi:MAG: ComEC/Rec2 family competence protein [Bacillota bacterium]|uniref:MBL fold metallo-hydrolase n=1 Tax=Thermanaerosceptrum fracticalcis TaxID=1712410 RepID=A0A7G6E394_THEFR|nr:ComEC/Rec2 family competence protein [Thermanaerosceptrum fracticalcis]QNB46548.1 MBL fold metallo-hydrolase [Thermanaerosceptrum fracticalcis]